MEIIFTVAMSTCGIGALFCVYMLVRNAHIWRVRNRVMFDKTRPQDENLQRLEKLPSYDKMMWQLLRWNWDDYLE